jgi:hypothetical protein
MSKGSLALQDDMRIAWAAIRELAAAQKRTEITLKVAAWQQRPS